MNQKKKNYMLMNLKHFNNNVIKKGAQEFLYKKYYQIYLLLKYLMEIFPHFFNFVEKIKKKYLFVKYN